MSIKAIAALAEALVGAIPQIVELVRKGRDPGSIKLDEVISTDALATLHRAQKKAQDFITEG